tara:strand:+ start:38 stop:1192 length:1155 start_codon:yes stop_codon:yes gene_type:complete
MHPFADTFIREDQYSLSEPVYPLQCFLDGMSGEIRVGVDTKADDRYNLYDYSYTSSNSTFSRNHWINYAREVSEKVELKQGASVVEIGSNDGFLAKQFKDLGYSIVGVDPSYEMTTLASKLGIDTFTRLFDFESSEDIKKDLKFVDLIVANNVFNHANDPLDFIKGIVNLLSVGGFFVYELPYWFHTIRDGKFDQIYHEHVTYFTAKSSYELLRKVGLEIVDIEVVNYHGGSLRVFAKKVEGNVHLHDSVRSMIVEEEEFGLFDEKLYEKFMDELHFKRNKFLKEIYKIKLEGHSIIGVGAAAKGNTFLNFYNLDSSVLDYVTDASEHKQGKYTPLTRIPIVGDEVFSSYDKVYALILSWNISDIIKENLKKINDKIEFISLPE